MIARLIRNITNSTLCVNLYITSIILRFPRRIPDNFTSRFPENLATSLLLVLGSR